jgi:4-hydroxy-4-methyl-2-oxoglutarate aldolase
MVPEQNEKTLTGRVPRDAIAMLEIPRLPPEVIAGFQSLTDLTGTISDAMDQLGLVGVIPATLLSPVLPGARMVGQALTVRNVAHALQVHKAALADENGQGEAEAHNLAQPGDVVVIEGIVGVSNMGGQSATIGHRQGEAGAVIDGSIRDPDASRGIGYPIWCRGITPITGKWRTQTVAINGPVHIVGVQVHAGDLVAADEAGVCFVPRQHAAPVLEAARRIDAGDARRKQAIAQGAAIAALVRKKFT